MTLGVHPSTFCGANPTRRPLLLRLARPARRTLYTPWRLRLHRGAHVPHPPSRPLSINIPHMEDVVTLGVHPSAFCGANPTRRPSPLRLARPARRTLYTPWRLRLHRGAHVLHTPSRPLSMNVPHMEDVVTLGVHPSAFCGANPSAPRPPYPLHTVATPPTPWRTRSPPSLMTSEHEYTPYGGCGDSRCAP